MRDWIKIYAIGICMGTADIIPGVSGGTIAWISGIYQRLITAISQANVTVISNIVKLKWKTAFRQVDGGFILCLLAGILSGIMLMVKVLDLPGLIRHHPEPVYGLFFGLILGSAVLLVLRLPMKLRYFISGALGIAAGLALVNLVPMQTPDSPAIMFLAGMIAITAMILPGISGSFLLLIMGKYMVVLEAIASGQWGLLTLFASGCIAGLLVFSRLIRWALTRFHTTMCWAISGVLIGSLWVIWPFQERQFIEVNGKEKWLGSSPVWPENIVAESNLLAIVMAFGGIAGMIWMNRLAQNSRNPQ